MGVMDTDALSNFVYGELYIPVTLKITDQPIQVVRRWTFPASMKSSISEFACDFEKPFWAPYEVNQDKRILKLPNYTIVEHLQGLKRNNSYSYTMMGIKDITEYKGSFALIDSNPSNEQLTLEWSVSFKSNSSQSAIDILTIVCRDSKMMTTQMVNHFGPSISE